MQKLADAPDLRVRRTRKLLQQALIEGSLKKGFVALTVRDITEYAMVNRSTFYRHTLINMICSNSIYKNSTKRWW